MELLWVESKTTPVGESDREKTGGKESNAIVQHLQ